MRFYYLLHTYIRTCLHIRAYSSRHEPSPRDSRSGTPSVSDNASDIKKLLVTAQQQISYLEESNQVLQKKTVELRETCNTLKKDNNLLGTNLNNALSLIRTHELTNATLQTQLAQQYSTYESEVEELKESLKKQKKDYDQQKLVLDQMSEALQRTVETEQRLRHQVESELNLARRKLQSEMELTAKLRKELDQLLGDQNENKN